MTQDILFIIALDGSVDDDRTDLISISTYDSFLLGMAHAGLVSFVDHITAHISKEYGLAPHTNKKPVIVFPFSSRIQEWAQKIIFLNSATNQTSPLNSHLIHF